MTMLDRMRQHKNWLKWSLAVVCLAFILFYIPAFLQQPSVGAGPHDVIAAVEGRQITVREFRRVYTQQVQAYRGAYGGNVSDRLLKQLGLDQQILQQLVDEQAALVEAERVGLRVSDAEVRQRIVAMPAFQEAGRFIGEARYRQILRLQSPPMTPGEFEESLRRGLLLEKLRAALTDWVTVADAEVEQEYRRRNEQVKLDLVAFTTEQLKDKVTLTDADLAAHFERNKQQFRIPERRRIRYLLVDVGALRGRISVSPQDVERYYNEHIEQLQASEQVRAAHILLKTEGLDEATVRKQAEALVARARAGADFAELAKQYSQDEATAQQGGDLDYFGRGRMVPEFEQAAFAMDAGAISEPVKTPYGFHIIKIVDKKPATTRALDEVRQQISDQVQWERAQAQADKLASALAEEIDDPGDLDRVARARGLTVQDSPLFARGEPIGTLGPSPEVAAEAFSLQQGRLAGPLRTSQGYVFLTVTGAEEAHVPKLDEVREKVREDLVRKRALELVRHRAEGIAPALKSAQDFVKAAKAAGLEPKSTALIARGAPLPDVGMSPAAEAVAFSLPVGSTSDVIQTDNGVVILRIAEKKDVSAEDFAKDRETLRRDLLTEQRARFFSAYMGKAKERMTIEIDRQMLQRVIA